MMSSKISAKRKLTITLLGLVAACCFTLGAFITGSSAETTGKKLITDYESGAYQHTLVDSTESAYNYGKMVHLTSGDDKHLPELTKTDWSGAKYVSFYVENRSNENAYLGFEPYDGNLAGDARKMRFKAIWTQNIIYADNLVTCNSVETNYKDGFGITRGVIIASNFKGYIKVSLSTEYWVHTFNESNAGVFDNVTHFRFETDSANVFIDTLVLSYDDDITTVYTNETVLFGRTPPTVLSGKKIITDYQDNAYQHSLVDSSESVYPYGTMIQLTSGDDKHLPELTKTDWSGAKYVSFYVENRNSASVYLGFEPYDGNLAGDARKMRFKAIWTQNIIYADNLVTCNSIETNYKDGFGITRGLNVPAEFKGYIKVSLSSEYWVHTFNESSEGVFDNVTHFRFETDSDNVYIDTLAISYDDDITSVYTADTALFGRKVLPVGRYESGKYIISDFDSRGEISTTESSYLSGKMALVKDNKYAADYGITFSGENKDFKGVWYISLYVHNFSNSDQHLRIFVKMEGSDTQYQLNQGYKLYLDAENADTVLETHTVDKFGSGIGITVPASFKGYVKLPLDDTNIFKIAWGIAGFSIDNIEGFAFMPGKDGNGKTEDSKMAIDTLVASYDNDIEQKYSQSDALFGRTEVAPQEYSGKKLVDGYDEDNLYKAFDLANSEENEMPSKMINVKGKSGYTVMPEIPVGENKLWMNSEYFMFYAVNKTNAEVALTLALNQFGANLQLSAAKKVYLDNGTVTEAMTESIANAQFGVGFKIPAMFSGWVKIPFNNEYFDSLISVAPIDSVQYHANGDIYVDSLGISLDGDIGQVFGGVFDNRTTADFSEGQENGYYVVSEFFESQWKRTAWDGKDSVSGDYGSVTYSRLADSMTVNATGKEHCLMWGKDFDVSLRDMSAAKYFVLKVVNNLDKEAKFEYIVSDEPEARYNFALYNGIYYLKDGDGNAVCYRAENTYISVPADFNGYVIVPVGSFKCPETGGTIRLGSISRFSFGFAKNVETSLTFSLIGYAVSDFIVKDAEIVLNDTSKYHDLSKYQDFDLPITPVRPITEPETSVENNVQN